MAGFNFGAFFGGGADSSSGGIFGSFNFSDYNSIKNGSYGKLVKSYYAKDKIDSKKSKTDKTDSKNETSKIDTKDSTGLSKMKKESDALAKAAEAMDSVDLWTAKNGKYDTDKIADAVKTFAKEYNDTISQASKVNNSEVAKQIENMKNMTSTVSKALSKIGVKADSEGKLTVNEDTLKNANIKDVKAMFDGSHSYAGQIEKLAEDASKAAVNSSSIYSADGSLSSPLSGSFTDWF